MFSTVSDYPYESLAFRNNWDIYTSSKAGDIPRVRFWVEEMGFDVNKHDVHNSTPLFYACLCGHTDLVRYLLDNGSKMTPGSFETERAFYAALNYEIKQILLHHKATPNRLDIMIETINKFRKDPRTSDFTLKIEDSENGTRQTTIRSHKFFLSCRSPWFRNKLMSDWKYTNEGEIVTGPEHEFNSFIGVKLFVEWIYTSELEIQIEHASEVSEAFTMLERPEMQTRIEKEMRSNGGRSQVLVIKGDQSRADLMNDLKACTLSSNTNYSNVNNHNNSDLEPSIESSCRLPEEHNFQDICIQFSNIQPSETSNNDSEQEDRPEHTNLVTVESCRIFAHRSVLVYHSPYFENLLKVDGVFTENSLLRQFASSIQNGIIPAVPIALNVESKLFVDAISFLYTNSLPGNYSPDQWIHLLSLSEMLYIPDLKRLCGGALRRILDMENVIDFLHIAEAYHSVPLKQACLDFAELHIKALKMRDGFADSVRTLSDDSQKEIQIYLDRLAFIITN